RARRLRRRVHRRYPARERLRRAISPREIVDGRFARAEELRRMEVIPSLDLLNGAVVRLTRGDFATATVYGDPESVLDSLNVPDDSRLHVVDLEASRSGKPLETRAVKRLASRELRVQVGGGIRSLSDARRWLDCGA